MKTSSDPRHLARISAVKSLFSSGFGNEASANDKMAKLVLTNAKKIDEIILGAAPQRKIDKINRVDLAILRLAVWELMFDKKNPRKAVIDEAIELAKLFGSESSPGFVNGVLGTILKKVEA